MKFAKRILYGLMVAAAAIGPMLPSRAQANVFSNVAEASSYTLVYSLAVQNSASYNFGTIPYSVDTHGSIANGSFSRVAYYMELQTASGSLQYAYASMDAFTTDASKLGVPSTSTGAFFQQLVTHMNVVSNVAGVVNGTGISTGRLEFWHTDYGTSNSAGVPGASNSTYDFGDQPVNSSNYGSMQINNSGAGQTILAYNNWGSDGGNGDLGIGNQAGGQPDWTFAHNAAGFTVKNIQVLVQTNNVPEPASVVAFGLGLLGLGLVRRSKRATSR
jgi:sialate O-acetylesterase